MTRAARAALLAAVGLALAAAGPAAGAGPGAQAAQADPTLAAALPGDPAPRFEPPEPGSYELPPIGRVHRHPLLASDGTPVAFPDLAPGEVAVVSLVYLGCGEACPLATATLKRLDVELARDPALAAHVRLATLSFDPENDPPVAMARLAASLSPRVRWSFLTAASPEAIEPVLADFGQDAVRLPAAPGEPPGRLRHVLKIFLIDDTGAIRNIYSTGLMDVRLVMADLRTLVLAADGGRAAH